MCKHICACCIWYIHCASNRVVNWRPFSKDFVVLVSRLEVD